jgi:urease accessory protein
MAAAIIMPEDDSGALIALQAWLSPAYPVGSYAYSHGLETAIDTGTVIDRETLCEWLESNLRYGDGWNDAVLFGETARYFALDEAGERLRKLQELAELASALNGTKELRQESLQQGSAFLDITRKAWPHPVIDDFAGAIGVHPAYPVCFALAAVAHGCPVIPAAEGFLFASVANRASAAVRLNVIGQTAGQEIAAALAPVARTIAQNGVAADLSELGSSVFVNEIYSLAHEKQNARLFRS